MILIGRGLDFRYDLEPIGKQKQTVMSLEAVQLSGLREAIQRPVRRKKRTTERVHRSNPSWNIPQFTISGGDNEGVTPVPIPNTEVKPFSADGTWLVTARESRSPPDPNRSPAKAGDFFCWDPDGRFHISSA